MRLLAIWGEPIEEDRVVRFPNVLVPPVDVADLFDDLFAPIARDGASTVQVGMRLQKAFAALSRFEREGFAESARRHSGEALECAEAALVAQAGRRRLRELAQMIG